MTISKTLNSRCQSFIHLNELINKLDIPKKMVAIELNKKIVDKKKLKKIILKQKDCLEIVHFIGGG